MSAIAKVLLETGTQVSGSDLKRSPAATMLEAVGADVHIGHDSRLVEGAGVVIVSSAIPEHNAELTRARELGVRVLTRGEALAHLLRGRRSIVVAGTHGKTTTTSMIVSILRASGIDPTYLVGGGLNDSGTNARSGRDELVVAEADESDGSFLLLDPLVAVVTNVEADHLDHWSSLEKIRTGFSEFVASTRAGGAVIHPAGDQWLAVDVGGAARVIAFGEAGTVRAEEVSFEGLGSRFDIWVDGASAPVTLGVPGAHNIANALAAAAACVTVDVPLEAVANGLSSFKGVERRFQVTGKADGVTVIDDYAHHPTEIRATLAAARPGPWSRIVAVFQPHRYSRTLALAEDFGPSFDDADRIVVTDVYGAGEEPVPGVSGKLVSDAVCTHLPGRPVAYLPHRSELVAYLVREVRSGDAVLTLGAGDVSSVGDELLAAIGASPS
jgi:UDP-N-acetylmuramate--alanine ligase